MITGTVNVGNALIRIDQTGKNITAELKISVTRAAIMMMAHVKENKLSGGVLNVKTGRLRRSINQSVKSDENSVIGQVGTNVSYGRFWELGFDRKLGAGTRGGPGARGGKVLTGKALASYYAKHPAGTKHEAPRSFLRSALADKRADILKEIDAGIQRAVKRS